MTDYHIPKTSEEVHDAIRGVIAEEYGFDIDDRENSTNPSDIPVPSFDDLRKEAVADIPHPGADICK